MQSTLEDAFSRVTQESIHVVGAGRTDAGAHAVSQVVSFSTTSSLRTDVLRRAANAVLPNSVAVTGVSEVEESFHPRFDALARTYRYVIWNRPVRSPFWDGRSAHVRPQLDQDRMNTAARMLIGRHDFGSFVPSNFEGARERTVWSAGVHRGGHALYFTIEADGFMRQMVRSMAGTLIDVGRGKLTADRFREVLNARDRTCAGRTAPASGLYLIAVRYPQGSAKGPDSAHHLHEITGLTAVVVEEKR